MVMGKIDIIEIDGVPGEYRLLKRLLEVDGRNGSLRKDGVKQSGCYLHVTMAMLQDRL
jgi:hypothetical protein